MWTSAKTFSAATLDYDFFLPWVCELQIFSSLAQKVKCAGSLFVPQYSLSMMEAADGIRLHNSHNNE